MITVLVIAVIVVAGIVGNLYTYGVVINGIKDVERRVETLHAEIKALTEALANRLHITPSVAAEKKAQVGVGANAEDQVVAETLRQATLDLVRQIQSTVQGAVQTVAKQGQLRAVLLAGGAANLPGIVEIFGSVFPGVPVQIGNPLINIINPESKQQSVLSPAAGESDMPGPINR